MTSSSDLNTWIRGQRNVRKITEKIFSGQKVKTCDKWNFVGNCFWTAVYLAGILLVALTCNDLYQKYKTKFTSINIALVNNSITIPDPTICVPNFNVDELIDYQYNINAMENTLTSYSEEYSGRSDFYINQLQEFFDCCTTWQEVRERDWPITLLHIAQIYLGMIYETESFVGNGKHPMEYMYDLTDNTTQSITDILIPKMNEWNVSLGKFKDAFSQQFRQFYKISATQLIGAPENDIWVNKKHTQKVPIDNRIQELVFVNRYQVCYKLKLNGLSFNDSSRVRMLIDHRNGTFGPRSDIAGSPGFNKWYEPVIIDMTGKRRAGIRNHPSDSIYYSRFYDLTQLTVKPSFYYKSLEVVKGNRQCSRYETVDECRAKCRSKSIETLCNCIAISLDWLPDTDNVLLHNDASCQFGQYETCLRNFTGGEDSGCMDSCLDFCTTWTFSVELESQDFGQIQDLIRYGARVTIIEIKVVSVDYFEIRENNDWTFTKITGVVGGALSFWLGVDIFTIVYSALITLILVIKNRCRSKLSRQDNTGNESVNDNIDQNSKTEKLWKLFIMTFYPSSNLLNLSKSERSSWILRKSVWAVLFFTGIALTIKDLVPLVISYKNNNTTFILNVQFNKTMKIPDIAICHPASSIDEWIYWLQWNGKKVDGDLFNQAELHAYFNGKNMSKEVFLDEVKSWSSTVMYTVLSYFEATHQITISSYDDMINHWIGISNNADFKPWIVLRSFLIKWSITDTELQQKFTSEYVKWYEVEGECISTSGTDGNISLIPTISFETTPYTRSGLGPVTVCFHFSLSKFEYKSNSDRCSIKIRELNSHYYTGRFLTVKAPNPYSPFIDMPLEYSRGRMGVTFGYSTIYQRLETTDCSKDNKPLLNCLNDCRNNWTDYYCPNCAIQPLDGSKNITEPRRKACEWEEYKACLKQTIVPLKHCSTECEKYLPCTLIEYTLNQAQKYTHFNNNTITDIYVKDFAYSLMKERPTWSTEEFIAACGGVLGFWIGLDATFIIEIFVTPLMLCIGVYIGKKTCTASTNNRHFVLDYIAKMVGITYKGMSRLMIVKALIEKQFWVAVYALLAVLTATHCLHYIKEYGSTLGSHFELMRNETFTIPAITICVPLHPWLTKSMMNSVNHHAANQIIAKSNVTKSMILDPNLPWRIHLFKSTLVYLTVMEGYKTPSNWSSTWSAAMNISEEEPKAFSEKMDELKITYKELIEKFDQEMRRRSKIHVTKYVLINGSLQEQELSMQRITFVSGEKICYALPSDAASFSSPLEYMKLSVPRMTITQKTNAKGCLDDGYRKFDGSRFTIDLLGRDDGADLDDFVLGTEYGNRESTSVSISRAVRVLPVANGEIRCSTGTSPPVCIEQCRISAVKLQCGCAPSECHFRQLSRCVSSFNCSDVNKCIGNCHSCERISYKYDKNSVGMWKQSPNYCVVEYRIGVSNFQYPLFSESLDTSLFDFIAAVGGLMCIWLPLDVIFFIDVFILLGKRLFCRKKQQQNIAQRRPEINELEDKMEKVDESSLQVHEID